MTNALAAKLDSSTAASTYLTKTSASETYLTKSAASDTYLGKTAKASSATTADSATTVTGTVAIANGGTGQTTVAAARNALGLGNTTGALPVANGGTGLTSSPSMLTNLASTTAANVLAASPRPGVTGTLPVANGGTGATSLSSVTVGKATNLETSRKINGVSFNAGANVVFAGFCSTAEGVAAKTVTTDSNFSLESNATVCVCFQYTNTAENPTLNVNNTGAKNIQLAGANVTKFNMPSTPVWLRYNGSVWQVVNPTAQLGTTGGVTGTLPVANGGTGTTSVSGIKTALSISNISNTQILLPTSSSTTNNAIWIA